MGQTERKTSAQGLSGGRASDPIVLNVERLTRPNIWVEDRETWDNWCAQTPAPSVFCTADWLQLWWEIYGSEIEPWVLRVRDGDGKTVGYAPLMRVVRKLLPGLQIKSIEFVGTGQRVCPEYLDVVTAPGMADPVRRAACEFLAENRGEWDRLWLSDGLAEDSLSRYAAQTRWPGAKREIRESLCPCVTLPSTWDEFLANRSRHMRRKVRQIGHRIERELAVNWRIFTADDDRTEAVALMTDLHTRARQIKGETGIFADEQYRRFHQAIITRLAQTDRLYLGILELDHRPAVFFYGFLFGGCFFNYQTGYDPAFGRYRPGWYALSRMFQDLINRGCTKVDFLRGDHDYKWHWSDGWRETINTAVFSRGPMGRLAQAAVSLREQLRARRQPALQPPDFLHKKR